MGLGLGFVDLDADFKNLPHTPVMVNDLVMTDKASQVQVNELIVSTYDGDTLEAIPSCVCGHLTKRKLIGITCVKCGTPVADHTERSVDPLLWIETLEGVNLLPTPTFWNILKKEFTVGPSNNQRSIIQWLCNPNYTLPKPTSKVDVGRMSKLSMLGFDRGLNNFTKNYKQILGTLIDRGICKSGTRRDREELKRLIEETPKKHLFAKHIPIPPKIAFITETNVTGVYADQTMAPALDAIKTIATYKDNYRKEAIEGSIVEDTLRRREAACVMAISQLAEYYTLVLKKNIGAKYGQFRRHIFGASAIFSYRGVITSIHNAHRYTDVVLPWNMGLSVFKTHIHSLLLAKGYGTEEIAELFIKAVGKDFNDEKQLMRESLQSLLDNCYYNSPEFDAAEDIKVREWASKLTDFKEVISGKNNPPYMGNLYDKVEVIDHKLRLSLGDVKRVDIEQGGEVKFYRGHPTLLQRNPSLDMLSIQCLNIIGFGDDPHNNTIKLSTMILPFFNADFDGKLHHCCRVYH